MIEKEKNAKQIEEFAVICFQMKYEKAFKEIILNENISAEMFENYLERYDGLDDVDSDGEYRAFLKVFREIFIIKDEISDESAKHFMDACNSTTFFSTLEDKEDKTERRENLNCLKSIMADNWNDFKVIVGEAVNEYAIRRTRKMNGVEYSFVVGAFKKLDEQFFSIMFCDYQNRKKSSERVENYWGKNPLENLKIGQSKQIKYGVRYEFQKEPQ